MGWLVGWLVGWLHTALLSLTTVFLCLYATHMHLPTRLAELNVQSTKERHQRAFVVNSMSTNHQYSRFTNLWDFGKKRSTARCVALVGCFFFFLFFFFCGFYFVWAGVGCECVCLRANFERINHQS